MNNSNIIPLSRISANSTGGQEGRGNNRSTEKSETNECRKDYPTLTRAEKAWRALERFRTDRKRSKNYCFGKQWEDIIEADGSKMTEKEYISAEGGVPLKSNLIRRLVRNVVGVWRSQNKEPVCFARDRKEQTLSECMSTLLQYNWQSNRMELLNARSLEEFLISGMAVQKKTATTSRGRYECRTDIVSPDMFFIDENTRDIRGWDTQLIGEIHDVTLNNLIAKLADSAEDAQRIRIIYGNKWDSGFAASDFGYANNTANDFYTPADPSMCRVVEVWTKVAVPRYHCHDRLNGTLFVTDQDMFCNFVEKENQRRLKECCRMGIPAEEAPTITWTWKMDSMWQFKFLSPWADILKEGNTPYAHGEHPYIYKVYPFIDGEIHSFVADVIDQQRYVNRLITIYDWVMRSSAKGVLVVPEECIPADTDINEIADEWSRMNGLIRIRAKPGIPLPQQITNSSANFGISELLNYQLKFFEDISGVNGALQGKPGYSNMSGTLYAQQTQNSTNSLLDLLDTFSSLVVDSATKDVKNIQQFYSQQQIYDIAGDNGEWNADSIKRISNIDFDLNISESTTTPAYRQMSNDILMQLWQKDAITTQQLLENGSFPFADKLLKSIEQQNL